MLRLTSLQQSGADSVGQPLFSASFTDPVSGTTLTKNRLSKEEAASLVAEPTFELTLTPVVGASVAEVVNARPLTP